MNWLIIQNQYGCINFFYVFEFFSKFWKMNVTLQIIDVFCNKIPFHIQEFSSWSNQQFHDWSLDFIFQKRYFQKRQKNGKNSYGFGKINKLI